MPLLKAALDDHQHRVGGERIERRVWVDLAAGCFDSFVPNGDLPVESFLSRTVLAALESSTKPACAANGLARRDLVAASHA